MTDVAEQLTEVADRYRHGHERPLGTYGLLDVVYGGLVVGLGVMAHRRRKKVPELSVQDLALIGVATHRLARTIAKDPILSPVRMPFTSYQGVSGPSELREEVVASGVGHALGELVTCPFCLAQWIATGFVGGMIFAPRATRLVAATFAGVALADFLQFAYAGAQQLSS